MVTPKEKVTPKVTLHKSECPELYDYLMGQPERTRPRTIMRLAIVGWAHEIARKQSDKTSAQEVQLNVGLPSGGTRTTGAAGEPLEEEFSLRDFEQMASALRA